MLNGLSVLLREKNKITKTCNRVADPSQYFLAFYFDVLQGKI